MTDNMQLSLIQSYRDNSSDMTEKQVLDSILEELLYRMPIQRPRIGRDICPKCNQILDYSIEPFCKYCGQALE